MKKAFIIYGPPGAGKGTQANLLAGKLGLIHFDTGKYLEQVVHDPANQKKPGVATARKQWDSGLLVTPPFVLKITVKKTEEIAKSDFGIVFSGSPRTVFEAFGDKEHKGLIGTLEELYGKKNIIPILLKVDPHKSILRNARRRLCSICKTAVLYNTETRANKTCPLCGGKLYRRILDNTDVLKTRINEYKNRTEPILSGLEKSGYKLLEVGAEPLPYKVFESILKKIK